MKVLGVDIGGTKMEAAVFSADGNKSLALTSKRVPTHRQSGYDNVLQRLTTLINDVLTEEKTKVNDLKGIGLGLPGSVDTETSQMLNGNTSVFIGKDLIGDLKKALNYSGIIKIANDANCFALAETLLGAGTTYKSTGPITAIGIILGTGVGGGVIINGQMLTGKNGGASELGHLPLKSHGHPCYCGRYGCSEQYLSGPALEAAFASRIYSQIATRPTAREIFELAKAQDPLAIAIVKDYKKNLADFLINLTNCYDPDFFVLGGGVSLQEIIYTDLEDKIARESFLPQSTPKVYQHTLGDSAGVIGAALLIN